MPAHLFHGENTFLIQEKLHLWQNKFIEKYHSDINCQVVEASSNIKAANIILEAETVPFLSEKRLIIIKDFFSKASPEEQKEILKKIPQLPDFTVLVFGEFESLDRRTTIYKTIQKITTVEEFPLLQSAALQDWIHKEIRKRNSQINPKESFYLGEIAGSNLWNLANEIAKLSSYCQNRPISISDIDLLTKSQVQLSIFQLTDFIGQKNLPQALKSLNQLIERGEEPMYIFHMIVRQFRLIIQVSELLQEKASIKNIIERLKLKPFVVSSTAKQARNYSLPMLCTIYQQLLDIEIAVKTGKIKFSTSDVRELKLALEKFIIKSCR